MSTIIHTTVFAAGENGGNPCPVILHADDMTSEEMRQIAEIEKLECAFVMASDTCDYHFKYFVPNHEMEMCIHATIAAVTVLVEQGQVTKQHLKIETLLGPINVEWSKQDGNTVVKVEQFEPRFMRDNPTKEEVIAALAIDDQQLMEAPIISVATSRYKLIVPLKDKVTLDQLTPDYETLWDLCDQYETTGFYPFAITENKEIYARQFPNRAGYNEDPATGVAASALGAYLTEYFILNQAEHCYSIHQGDAMGKPSMIQVENKVNEDSEILQTFVIGSAVIIR